MRNTVLLTAFVLAALVALGPDALAAAKFDPGKLFPAWGMSGREVHGVIGVNEGALDKGKSQLLLYFLPRVADLLLLISAPIIFVIFSYSGVRFVYSGGDEEDRTASKKFFFYGIVGVILVAISYSLMKGVYLLLQHG